jgi:hypothetical protein
VERVLRTGRKLARNILLAPSHHLCGPVTVRKEG